MNWLPERSPTITRARPDISGRVDESQLFYAMTRGFTRREAVRMIVAGFFQQVFDRITIESVREALGEAIGRRVSDIRDLGSL